MTGVEQALLFLGLLMVGCSTATYVKTKSATLTALVVGVFIAFAFYAGLIA